MENAVENTTRNFMAPPVHCGDVELDSLAEILFEARRCLVMKMPVVTLEALNVALDIVSGMQTRKG